MTWSRQKFKGCSIVNMYVNSLLFSVYMSTTFEMFGFKEGACKVGKRIFGVVTFKKKRFVGNVFYIEPYFFGGVILLNNIFRDTCVLTEYYFDGTIFSMNRVRSKIDFVGNAFAGNVFLWTHDFSETLT